MAPKIIKSAKFEDGSYAIEAPRMGVSGPSPDVDAAASPVSEAQLIIQNAHLDAALIIQDAQAFAQQILHEARTRAKQEADSAIEQARAQAVAEGFEVGIEQGKQAASVEIGQQLAAIMQAHMAAQDARTAQLQELEHELLELSLSIAAKLVAVELGHSRKGAVAMVRAALQHLSERQRVRLRVHPLDLHVLTQSKQALMDGVDGLGELELVPDTRLGLGGCVVETATGTIDARLGTQLREIAFHLLNATPTVDGEALPASVQAAILALGPAPLDETGIAHNPLSPAVVSPASEAIVAARQDVAEPEVSSPVVTIEAATWDDAIQGALPPPTTFFEGGVSSRIDDDAGAEHERLQVLDDNQGMACDDQVRLPDPEALVKGSVAGLGKRGGKGLRGLKPRSG